MSSNNQPIQYVQALQYPPQPTPHAIPVQQAQQYVQQPYVQPRQQYPQQMMQQQHAIMQQPIQYGIPMPQGQNGYSQIPIAQGIPIQQGITIQQGIPMQQAPRAPTSWTSSLCDCCSGGCNTCCLATFFPPALWARTVAKTGIMSRGRAFALYGIPWLLLCIVTLFSFQASFDAAMNGYDYEAGYMQQFLVLSCQFFMLGLGISMRRRIRAKYAVLGSSCGDCCTRVFFPCCASIQEAHHVTTMEAMQQL